ncbi:hypothetical protein [Saccharothrix lopnurensis]|uniref:Uncharacterized protein n=1 Tax=Saccharothrix lopnurensis TaxID=1670621 RepID=A0ABW1P6M7_9PSEU
MSRPRDAAETRAASEDLPAEHLPHEEAELRADPIHAAALVTRASSVLLKRTESG